MNIDNLVSVATVINNNSDIIESFLLETTAVLSKAYDNYEILLIDNGSTDDSASKVKLLQCREKNIRMVTLSRKYNDEITYTAALSNCIGDFVVLMDINGDPPSIIPELVNKSISGYDITIAERVDNGNRSLIDRIFSSLFFKVSRFLTGYQIDPKFSKYIVFSRRAVNSLVKIKHRSRYIKFLIFEIGFRRASVAYTPINRSGKTKKNNYFEAFAFAAEVIVSNSEKLIRVASLAGLLAGLLNIFFVVYVLIGYLFFRRYIPQGWASTQILSATMFFIIFLILAIIGEYVARILRETQKGELYHIADESNSSVVPGSIEKKNVI